MADNTAFFTRVLQGLGLQATPWRMNFLNEWARWEGAGASFNPLATTQTGGEDPSNPHWNSNGGNPVKNYASEDNGVAATVKTLKNGYYPAVLQSLEAEDIASGASDNIRTWGTTGFANTLDGGGLGEPGATSYSSGADDDPWADPVHQGLIQQANEVMQDWIEGGRDENDFDEFVVPAINALNGYREVNGISPRPSRNDEASEKFDQWAKLEDINMAKADRAYQQWSDKNTLARQSAENQINEANSYNAGEIAKNEARAGSWTPELEPGASGVTKFAPNYEDALERWKTKYGAGGEAPASYTPGTPPGMGTSAPRAPATGSATTGVLPASSNGYQPGNPWSSKPEDQPRGAFMGPEIPPVGTGRPTSFMDSFNRPRDTSQTETSFDFGLRNPVKGAKAKVRKWWQKIPGLAGGGTNIPAGQYQLGEQGPEILSHPGFGEQVVGQNGPEMRDLPEGSSVIPADEAYNFHRIKQAAMQPPDPAKKEMEAQQRANDPELQAKVMASLDQALTAFLAANPPPTPILTDGLKDYWEPWRGLTGIAALPPEMEGANAAQPVRS